jgi:hypothetical protein
MALACLTRGATALAPATPMAALTGSSNLASHRAPLPFQAGMSGGAGCGKAGGGAMFHPRDGVAGATKDAVKAVSGSRPWQAKLTWKRESRTSPGINVPPPHQADMHSDW